MVRAADKKSPREAIEFVLQLLKVIIYFLLYGLLSYLSTNVTLVSTVILDILGGNILVKQALN